MPAEVSVIAPETARRAHATLCAKETDCARLSRDHSLVVEPG
jgi:hypothetical protein